MASGPRLAEVFFSYARRDAVRSAPVVKALRDRGLEVFVDDASIREHESISGVSHVVRLLDR
jgi:hypothetical protein